MRRFRDIVEDIKAPSTQSLWLDKGKLKFFGTKGWTLVAGEEGPDLSGYAKLTDIGTEESFVFTLEDGSKVTKSIRVLSTITTPAT